MSVNTRSQKLAQEAYKRVSGSVPPHKEYASFARKFPALIHTCGLAQAIAFALAQGGQQEAYVKDLAEVLKAGGHTEIASADILARQTREQTVTGYLRLSRDAIEAASWLKRYVEALAEDKANA